MRTSCHSLISLLTKVLLHTQLVGEGPGSNIENSVLVWPHTDHVLITPLGRLSCGAETVAQGRLAVDSEGCSSPWMKRWAK